MKHWLQGRLSARWVSRVRRLGRLRWITKYRLLHDANVPIRPHLAYIVWDPEVESFSYHLANVADMLATIAEATGVPLSDVEGFAREAQSDPELGDRLAHRLRWRFDVKRRPGLGHRLGWYVLLRALRRAPRSSARRASTRASARWPSSGRWSATPLRARRASCCRLTSRRSPARSSIEAGTRNGITWLDQPTPRSSAL